MLIWLEISQHASCITTFKHSSQWHVLNRILNCVWCKKVFNSVLNRVKCKPCTTVSSTMSGANRVQPCPKSSAIAVEGMSAMSNRVRMHAKPCLKRVFYAALRVEACHTPTILVQTVPNRI